MGLDKAIDVIPGMRQDLFLHAGPPVGWERASGPLRGAIIGGLLLEGRAKERAEAEELARRAQIRLSPATTTRRSGRWPG